MLTSGSSAPNRSKSATATSRRRSRPRPWSRRDGLDDEPQCALDVTGVECGDDERELAGGAKLLEQRVGTRWREQLVEEGVDGRR